MKLRFPLLIASLFASSVSAHSQTTSEIKDLFKGKLYSRASVSYQQANDYHSGKDSSASLIFETLDGEYTFTNYTFDFVYILKNGLYIASGLYSSSAKVETSIAGVPDTDSGIELREVPLAIGYDKNFDSFRLRAEARYIFNEDKDFENGSIASANVLPVTDGSDSLTLSLQAKTKYRGFEHSLLVGYQFYEDDVSHPLYPSFSLGDRFILDYEIGKVVGDLRISVGHLYSQAKQTEGTPGFNGTAYLTEKPRYSELRAQVTYKIAPRFLIDGGLKYEYDGSDAPKQETIFLGAAYIF